MKNFIVSEKEREIILEKYYGKSLMMEQPKWLSRLFASEADDVVRVLEKDAVTSLDDLFGKVFTRPGNLVARTEGGVAKQFLKSASGAEVPMETVKKAIDAVAKGKLQPNQILNYLPRNLADGTEFRTVVQKSLEKKGSQVAAQQGAKQLGQFETKNLLKNCFNHSYCDSKSILNTFYNKLGGSAKLTKFDPSKVKVLEKSNVAGREVINVSLEDGTSVLFYKSSGANVATTGKQAGEWFVIPGFAENGWFFKTKETINLTKGGNKYLTDMAEFLRMNGSNKLGR